MGVSIYDPDSGRWNSTDVPEPKDGFNDRAHEISRIPEPALQIVPVSQETPATTDNGYRPWYRIPQ